MLSSPSPPEPDPPPHEPCRSIAATHVRHDMALSYVAASGTVSGIRIADQGARARRSRCLQVAPDDRERAVGDRREVTDHVDAAEVEALGPDP